MRRPSLFTPGDRVRFRAIIVGTPVPPIGTRAAARLEATHGRAAVAIEHVAIVAFLAWVEDAIAAMARCKRALESKGPNHAGDGPAETLPISGNAPRSGERRAHLGVARDGEGSRGGVNVARELQRPGHGARAHDLQFAVALRDLDETTDRRAEAERPDAPSTG